MEKRTLTTDLTCQFKEHLSLEERSENTTQKYMCDIKAFLLFLSGATLTKEIVIEYKKHLQPKQSIHFYFYCIMPNYCVNHVCDSNWEHKKFKKSHR